MNLSYGVIVGITIIISTGTILRYTCAHNVMFTYTFFRILFLPVIWPVCPFHLDIFPPKIIDRLSVIIYTRRVFVNKRPGRPGMSETNYFLWWVNTRGIRELDSRLNLSCAGCTSSI